MPDIAMCTNERCTQKDKCYRHTAKPSVEWQSYAYFAGGKKCEFFWEQPVRNAYELYKE